MVDENRVQAQQQMPAEPIDGEVLIRQPGDAPAGTVNAPLMMPYQVLCQAVESKNGRSALSGVRVICQLVPGSATGPLATGTSRDDGTAELSVPVDTPFALFGYFEEKVAKRQVPAMSSELILSAFPGGIPLDFFFAPVTVAYDVRCPPLEASLTWYLTASTEPISHVYQPRDEDATDVLRLSVASSASSGELEVLGEGTIYWAVLDAFGDPVLEGRSDRHFYPGDTYRLEVDLASLTAWPWRYFTVGAGEELLQGLFMNDLQFQIGLGPGVLAGVAHATVPASLEFSVALPAGKDLILILHHPRAEVREYHIGAREGISPDRPILLELAASTLVHYLSSDYPDVVLSSVPVFMLHSGLWRTGALVPVEGPSNTIEIIGGWSDAVRSLRMGDHLFAVSLAGQRALTLPCPEIREIALAKIEECSITLNCASVLEDVVVARFYVRDELWQVNRVRAPYRTRIEFATRLPLEPGFVVLQEGRGAETTIPFVPDAANSVQLVWVN